MQGGDDPALTVPVPANLQPFVRVLGVDLAIEFLAEFGGAPLYLGHLANTRSRLVRLVGVDRATELAAIAERMPRRVPLGKRWIVEVHRARGLPIYEIARRVRATDVSVRRWLQAAEDRQLRLL